MSWEIQSLTVIITYLLWFLKSDLSFAYDLLSKGVFDILLYGYGEESLKKYFQHFMLLHLVSIIIMIHKCKHYSAM